MPLMASLGDDPYLAEFIEGKKLVDQYYDMTQRIHIDLVKRAIV